ncbi:cytochrome b/b6 domain-containing protein [Streptomyces sp. SCSIO 75703]|uniref:ferric reductase-like transmembrane domain-containing protein n=1 Tax=unclassified Streptomyces TaxID=2593676 RepID=UPI0004C0B3F2|nr:MULTISPECIES: ferric reductase-like transmembrane domain-containing protein [unclassified Streptomyces]
MTTDSSTAGDTFAEFLNFGAGVLSLVFLSCSVIWGLVAQDRVVLDTRRRIMAQAVHRSTAVASIVFLLVHITIKLVLDHTTWVAAVIPFGLLATEDEAFGGRGFLIGLGTVAGLLMIFVGVTGILRNRFASPAPVAARWRAMHMLAYPAWCAALIHGLYAGRAAKPIFLILYGLSLLGVMGALALRVAPQRIKRQAAEAITRLLGTDGPDGHEAPRERRGRSRGSSALPGYEDVTATRAAAPAAATTAPQPRYERAERVAPPVPEQPADGFAAAYRAVSAPPRPPRQAAAPQGVPPQMPMDMRPTEAMPVVDTGGSTSGNWPIPSPPPVGEAPPSAYDPLNDTGYTIPAYGNPGTQSQSPSDVYDTGETNGAYAPYNPNDTYNSGPATETTPGVSYDFGAPGSGEPWNTPSGGFQ